MSSGAIRRTPRAAADLHGAVVRFLSSCTEPALLDPGEPLLPLDSGNYCLEMRGGRLIFEAWDNSRNLVRRVIDITGERRGRLELQVEKFGGRAGKLWLVDRTASHDLRSDRDAARFGFRERFRRFLRREFPGWQAEVSSEKDLEHSFSGACARAFLKKGQSGIAAVGAPPGHADSVQALAAGLLWLDYLRRREIRAPVDRLVFYLPADSAPEARQRIRFLDNRGMECVLYVYGDEESAAPIDLHDAGNLDTRLEPLRTPPPALCEMIDRLAAASAVERVTLPDGEVSLRVRGLEFVRTRGGAAWFGLERKAILEPHSLGEAARLAAEVDRVRRPDAPSRRHPLYLAAPELWLESVVRAGLHAIDGTLEAAPVYGQVAAWAGGQRGVIDLLAVDYAGRLAVVELKASEDLYLPLQALDYWMRVKWHHDRGELQARGYFPGLALQPRSPRLLLVSPSLHFHPTTQTLLRFLSPEIDAEAVGVGAQWRDRVEVAFRTRKIR
jgi:hypothetical protein